MFWNFLFCFVLSWQVLNVLPVFLLSMVIFLLFTFFLFYVASFLSSISFVVSLEAFFIALFFFSSYFLMFFLLLSQSLFLPSFVFISCINKCMSFIHFCFNLCIITLDFLSFSGTSIKVSHVSTLSVIFLPPYTSLVSKFKTISMVVWEWIPRFG